jgi:Beta/Gamma crystallin
MAEVILYEKADFGGAHKHVFDLEPDLGASEDDYFNDKVSSIVVRQGNWSFYAHADFRTKYAPILGPGLYRSVSELGIANDKLSSLEPVTDDPTVAPPQFDLQGHILLFEHDLFRGNHAHKFIRGRTPAGLKVSSFVILNGVWKFYRGNFQDPFPLTVGRSTSEQWHMGGVPQVTDAGITNDEITTLKPVPTNPAVVAPILSGHVVLFEHANFRGAHKHVFMSEPDLKAPQDSFFNDKTSSFAVLSGNWQFYAQANFELPGSKVLYPSGDEPNLVPRAALVSIGLDNDSISSLSPL